MLLLVYCYYYCYYFTVVTHSVGIVNHERVSPEEIAFYKNSFSPLHTYMCVRVLGGMYTYMFKCTKFRNVYTFGFRIR